MESITIDLVPYEVKKKEPRERTIDQRSYTLKNFLGMEGIKALKRANPYNEESGYVGYNLINVSENELEIFCDSWKRLEEIIGYLLNAYPSIGWECLDQCD